MTAADITLLVPGSAIALGAGLLIYGLGVSTPDYRSAVRRATDGSGRTGTRP